MLILSSLFLNRVEEASFLIKSSESPKIRYNYTISHINSKLYVETSDRYSIPMRRRDFKKRQGMWCEVIKVGNVSKFSEQKLTPLFNPWVKQYTY